jgi:site-specific recombinase XerD
VLSWVQNGKQRRKVVGRLTTMSKREAELVRKAKELELATGKKLLNVSVRSILWTTFCDQYLDWRVREFPSSAVQVKSLVDGHLRPKFEHLTLDRITSDSIEEYKAERLEEVRAATVVKELNTLRAMFEYAITKKLVQVNPGRVIPNPQLLNSVPREFYTLEQLKQLYAAEINAGYDAMWKLFANTGMRRKEGLQLKWTHVTAKSIRILSTEEARTKSAKWREVPLTESGIEALMKLRVYNQNEFVLPRMELSSLSRAFTRTAKRALLPGSIHWLRHTFISHLVMAGRPLRTVQVLAGHSTIAVTEKYAHLAPDYMADVMKGINL